MSHLMLIAAATVLFSQALGTPDLTKPLVFAFATYFIYGAAARIILLPHHVRAMRLFRKKQLYEAIQAFQRSEHDLATRPWIDRHRWIVLMSASSISYLEMAMYNIASAQLQLGLESQARRSLAHFLEVAPGSPLALRVRAALHTMGGKKNKK